MQISTRPGDLSPKVDRYFAPLLLVGSVLLLQYHSIAFWNEHVGPLGWGWSILLEAGALYLWYRRNIALRLIGFVVSGMLLAGPLYTVAEPLLDRSHAETQTAEQRERIVAALETEIPALQRELDDYIALRKSGALGWHTRIDETRARLAERREQLYAAYGQGETASLNWKRQAVIVMQAIALFLYQFFSILAVTTLSRRHSEHTAKENSGRGSDGERPMPATPALEGVAQPVGVVASVVARAEDVVAKRVAWPAGDVATHAGTRTTERLEAVAGVVARPARLVAEGVAQRGSFFADVAPGEGSVAEGVATGEPGVAIGAASQPATTKTGEAVTESAALVDNDDGTSIPVDVVERICEALEGHLEQTGLSQRGFADRHGYDRREISLLKRHRDHVDAGRRTASNVTIRKLGRQLGVLPAERVTH